MSNPADDPPISLERVEESVRRLKLRKASGVTELFDKLLKHKRKNLGKCCISWLIGYG